MVKKKIIVISAVNLFEGGPLSILNDCLAYLNQSFYTNTYKIIALVHKKELFTKINFKHIIFLEFPKSRKNYFYRLYYEYLFFKKLSKRWHPYLWYSLHDISPNVKATIRAVYCHNPSPFNSINFRDIFIQPTQIYFRLFYKYLYSINIKKNKFVVVQQLWIKQRFVKMFDLKQEKIIVAKPKVSEIDKKFLENGSNKEFIFFFPTFPRPFKNIGLICKAVKLINATGFHNFKVKISIDGTENKYSSSILKTYGDIACIDFIGLLSRENVFVQYAKSDCLIFPSKLETWGLPISEFRQFNKPMIISDLPYARETVGNFDKVIFFNPNDEIALANIMKEIINKKKIKYSETVDTIYPQPFAENWGELFNILLQHHQNA